VVCWRGCELSERSELSLALRLSGFRHESEQLVGKYLNLAQEVLSRRIEAASDAANDSTKQAKLGALVDEAQ
jgi:hypothetical protein